MRQIAKCTREKLQEGEIRPAAFSHIVKQLQRLYQLLFCCEEYTDKSQPGERIYFRLQFQRTGPIPGRKDSKRQKRHACRNRKMAMHIESLHRRQRDWAQAMNITIPVGSNLLQNLTQKFLQPSQIAPPTGDPVFTCPPLVGRSYSNHNINDFKK